MKNMQKFFLSTAAIVGATVLLATPAMAAPCTLNANVLGQGPCEISDGGHVVQLDNFSVDVNFPPGVGVEIQIDTVFAVGNVLNVNWSVIITGANPPTGPLDFIFRYSAQGVSGDINGLDLRLFTSGVSVAENACLENWCAFLADPQPIAELNQSSPGGQVASFDATGEIIFISKDINLANGVAFSEFGQSYHFPVPEPATLLLLGTGLLGIGLLRRRN